MDETPDREKARKALVETWENTPSPNPRFKGLTPREVVRALVRRPPAATSRDQGKGTDQT